MLGYKLERPRLRNRLRAEAKPAGQAGRIRHYPGVTTYGDPQLLRIVLENLLSNAWKFSAPSACARIEFDSALQADGSVAFFVRDNGVGFDTNYAGKLFAPFQRLHSEKEFAGTGIGLATVQRIIHRHFGRVWAQSEVGKGASFYFTISGENRKDKEIEKKIPRREISPGFALHLPN